MSDDWEFDFDSDDTSFSSRERRRREIDAEFGDETENWYHKWIEGVNED